jgi:hypothetical protein
VTVGTGEAVAAAGVVAAAVAVTELMPGVADAGGAAPGSPAEGVGNTMLAGTSVGGGITATGISVGGRITTTGTSVGGGASAASVSVGGGAAAAGASGAVTMIGSNTWASVGADPSGVTVTRNRNGVAVGVALACAALTCAVVVSASGVAVVCTTAGPGGRKPKRTTRMIIPLSKASAARINLIFIFGDEYGT